VLRFRFSRNTGTSVKPKPKHRHLDAADRVRWTVDGRDFDKAGSTYRWTVTRDHRVAVAVWHGNELFASLGEIAFHVK